MTETIIDGDDVNYTPPVLIEEEEELDEAVSYLQDFTSITNDKRLYNTGKHFIELYGGTTIDQLLYEAQKIRTQEFTRKDVKEMYAEARKNVKNERDWYKSL